jgi:hypothetical protein
MKTIPLVFANCLLAAGLHGAAYAQATPAATGTPTIPSLNVAPLAGQLNYSLSASQSFLVGYNGGDAFTGSANVSGNAGFVSASQSHPLSFLYSGGYLFGESTGQPNSLFQDFGISQELITRHYVFLIGDQVSYLPNSPVFGLSGVPGLGDIGTQPIGTGSLPVESILTNYGKQVSNTAHGSATAKLSAETSLSAFGDYTLLRFPSNSGISTDEVDGGASLNHRLDARNTIGVGYNYSNFSYGSGQNISITSQAVTLQYQHVFSRQLLLAASVGPQRTSSSEPDVIPTGTNVAADLSLFYSAKSITYLLSFNRGTTSGAGVLEGTLSDNVNFTASRQFGRDWSGGFSANYGDASSLETVGASSFTAKSFYAGLQATRKLGRNFSAYGSYNVETQSTRGSSLGVNAFNGVENVIGLGITYSPRAIQLGHP